MPALLSGLQYSWTIPANRALAFNSNIEYSILEIDDLEFLKKKIIVAKKLIETLLRM